MSSNLSGKPKNHVGKDHGEVALTSRAGGERTERGGQGLFPTQPASSAHAGQCHGEHRVVTVQRGLEEEGKAAPLDKGRGQKIWGESPEFLTEGQFQRGRGLQSMLRPRAGVEDRGTGGMAWRWGIN